MIRMHCDFCERRLDSPWKDTVAQVYLTGPFGMHRNHDFCSVECLKKFVANMKLEAPK